MTYESGMNLENKKILIAHGDSFTYGIGWKSVDGKKSNGVFKIFKK